MLHQANNATSGQKQLATIDEVFLRSVELSEVLTGIDLMDNEGSTFDGPRIAITRMATREAVKLSDDLERLRDAHAQLGTGRDRIRS